MENFQDTNTAGKPDSSAENTINSVIFKEKHISTYLNRDLSNVSVGHGLLSLKAFMQ